MPPLTEIALQADGDGELLRRLRAGDAAAFAALMRQNNRRLYRVARGILRDDGEAEEAVQEGYVRALTRLDGFRGQASLATWLARIVANEALGRLRRRRPSIGIENIENSSPSDSPFGAAENETSPEHAAARREIRHAIESAIDALPAPFRVVFVLRAIEQLSTGETAISLGIPEETVKTRLHRANKLLREMLSGEFASIWDDPFPFAGERCDRLVARVIARIRGGAAPAERGFA